MDEIGALMLYHSNGFSDLQLGRSWNNFIF